MGKHKEIVRNQAYLKEIKEFIKKGGDITSATRKLCAKHKLEFTDSLRRSFSRKLAKIGDSELPSKQVPIEHTDEYKEAVNRELPKSKYYIVSWSQASTELHEGFWNNILAFSEHIGAEIIIQPSRYKSPTSLEASQRIEEKERNKNLWDERIRPYLYAKRLKLNNYLTVLTDCKVQPTAKTPISGLNGFTGESSTVLCHPKVQLKSLPKLPSNPHKLILTTGSVTLPNYTDTKIGLESKWTHEFGFVLAEIVDENKYYLHQVIADDNGTFYFLDYLVENGEVSKSTKAYPAVVFGDVHYGETDSLAYNTSIKLAKRLRTENLFLHDVGNMHSISHHDLRSPLTMLKKESSGKDDLQKEIDIIIKNLRHLDETIEGQLHVVESNHPLWIDRWLDTNDWRVSNNKYTYLKLANLVASGKTEGKGVLNYLIEQDVPSIKTYTEDDSLKIKGYECLIHGHRGVSSSKGGINQFKNLSTKGISCHSHSPERYGGWLVGGTLTDLKPDYVKGLGSWMHSNVIITPNGKATHVHIIDGEFTTL